MTRREFIGIMCRVSGDITNPDVCWLWTRSKTDGYGNVGYRGKVRLVYNILADAIKGVPCPGLERDHLCRVRACVNWHHIEYVTKLENQRRGNSGINSRMKTHCPQGHEYNETNTYRYKSRRFCRACRRMHDAVHYIKERYGK